VSAGIESHLTPHTSLLTPHSSFTGSRTSYTDIIPKIATFSCKSAPVFTALVSLFYYKKFYYTTPLVTALCFLLFVFVMDAGLVAPVFEKSSRLPPSSLLTSFSFWLFQ
jgi:hypothetical protein